MGTSTTNRPPLTYLFSPFSDVERDTLERFVRKVSGLQESQFPNASLNIIVSPAPSPGPNGGQGWTVQIDGPDEREVKMIIGDFRQIYTPTHRTSAPRVITMLKEHAHERDTDASRRMIRELKECGKQLRRRKREDPRGYYLEETPDGDSIKRSPDSVVRDWFNGVYFHDDLEASELERDGHTIVEMLRWTLQYTIKDSISEWGKLKRLVEAILRDPALRRS
jgi:hypothetical protein